MNMQICIQIAFFQKKDAFKITSTSQSLEENWRSKGISEYSCFLATIFWLICITLLSLCCFQYFFIYNTERNFIKLHPPRHVFSCDMNGNVTELIVLLFSQKHASHEVLKLTALPTPPSTT